MWYSLNICSKMYDSLYYLSLQWLVNLSRFSFSMTVSLPKLQHKNRSLEQNQVITCRVSKQEATSRIFFFRYKFKTAKKRTSFKAVWLIFIKGLGFLRLIYSIIVSIHYIYMCVCVYMCIYMYTIHYTASASSTSNKYVNIYYLFWLVAWIWISR